jgi:phospholipid/cholesterol/gamma-HCH transport system substrate-binding protein
MRSSTRRHVPNERHVARVVRRGAARLHVLLFAAATLALFIALYLFIKQPALFNRGRHFNTVFRSAAGLNVGDEVRFGGLQVGTVTKMDLDDVDPTKIKVEFRVRRKTPVRTNTRASVEQLGLLGKPYLSLAAGRADAPELPAGSTLPSEENYSFQEAMNQLALFFGHTDTIFNQFEKLATANPAERVNAAFERVDRTLGRLESLVDNTARESHVVMAQMDTASRRLNSVLERSERIVVMVDSTLRAAGPGLSDAQREMLTTLRETRSLLADVRDAMNQGGGIDQLVRNAAIATDNLARLSTRLERDPTSVLMRRKLPSKPAGPAVK